MKSGKVYSAISLCAMMGVLSLPILLILAPSSLFADIVRFKDGRVEDNVKSRVLSSVVVINYPDGTMQTVPKFQLRSVKIRPVNWPEPDLAASPEEARLEEQIRVAEASEKGDTWEPRPEDEKINPWTSAGYGLIPGYSGHFHTNQPVAGYSFAIAEGILLLNALDFATGKRSSDPAGIYPALAIFGEPISDPEAERNRRVSLGFNYYQWSQTYTLRGGITGRTILSAQEGEESQRTAYEAARNQTYGALALVMLLDAGTSYLNALEWNQGQWSGDPLKRPVDPLQSALRSLIFPGWGQIYSGQYGRGKWMIGVGGALLSYAFLSEQKLVSAQRSYVRKSELAGQVPVLELLNILVIPDDMRTLQLALVLPARKEVEQTSTQRNNAIRILGAFWAYNILDAIWGSRSAEGTSVSPYILPDSMSGTSFSSTRIGLSVRWRF